MVAFAPDKPKLLTVQYLRAGAALAVVFFHANGISQEYFGRSWSNVGAAGVDVFFVVSGFIMWMTATSQTSPFEFLKNRIVRIVPLYWAITLALFASLLVVRGGHTAPSLDHLAKSLLFIPHLSSKTGEINPVLIVGWTLNFEMFFYAVFAVSLVFRQNLRAPFLLTALSLLAILGMWLSPEHPILKVYTSPLLLEFALGCGLAIVFQRGLMPRWHLGAAIGAVGLVALLLTQGPATDLSVVRLIHWGIPAFLVVVGALSFEPVKMPQKIFLLLGGASYSIYLIHSLVISAIKDVLLSTGTAPDFFALFILASFMASTASGVVIYLTLESRLQSFLKARLTQKASLSLRA